MKITDLINIDSLELDIKVSSKEQAIDKLIELMLNNNNIVDPQEYKKCVLERESQGSTGIGEGIAIPHAKTSAVSKAGISCMVVPNGVEFDSLDGMSAKLFFLIAAPQTEENIHLDVLGALSTLLMNDEFREKLINSKSKQEFIDIINSTQTQKEQEKSKNDNKEKYSMYDVLAVTACPTGIAHTYMAAEGLENAAKELGVKIKVETNGSGGVKNELTEEEIKNAKCIIITADKKVNMSRFKGKALIQTKVSDGIHKPKELIQKAINGEGKIYVDGDENTVEDMGSESASRKIYKHLMSGVSHMLPFVIGGGILIALAFLFDDFSINPDNFGKNTPFASFLKTVGETAFGFMLPVLAGYIASSIGDKPALVVGFVGGMIANTGGAGFIGALIAGFIAGYIMLFLKAVFAKLPKSLEGISSVLLYPVFGVLIIGAVIVFIVNPPVSTFNEWLTNFLNNMGSSSKVILGIILGGMMSIDFGGPINKAAYVFGTASIATGQYDIMAAVMIGGMVPPISIALATMFFKNKFSNKERQSGLTNFIMGLSFITEGAIPFAASDPLRIIPSCAIGSAVAGGLSMLFGSTLRAPHGGIFVFPVVGNPLMYLLSLAIGSVVGMILIGIMKKKVANQDI